jgi:amino acid adenylation domain-containing protein
MSDTKQRIAALPPEKRAQLIRQLQKKGVAAAPAPIRRRPSGSEPGACSFAQQRLWFLEQLQPGTASNNLPVAMRLKGRLDVSALERAFTELVRRHESLRTTFQSKDGEPVQVLRPAAPLPLPVIDLSTHEAPEAEARRLAAAEAQHPFDITQGPLLRASLLRLGEDVHVLLLTMHHIVSDAASMGVLVRELTALYGTCHAGSASPLPEPPLQYADFAAWQRAWLQGEVLEEQLGWWRTQLAGVPESLELPTDFPRPPVRTFRGGAAPISLPPALSEALKALCKQEGATPFMGLMAAFQALLGRLCGQRDVCVGSPVAGRRFAELEGLIGFFVNTLVFRGRLGGNPSYRALLAQVRETALGAFAHQDVPFEKLVEELHPTRDLSRPPLFQALFSLQDSSRMPLASAWLTLEPLEPQAVSSRFDLELNLSDTPEGFTGALLYNADLFQQDTAERIARYFVRLLDGLVTQPERPLGLLPLLPPEEHHRVVVEWNETDRAYPRDSTIPEVFERVVAARPDAIALEFHDTRLTYRELDARANQLAWRLRALGVGPDVPVALCLERSVELIVSLLAILKAGGAYVPLDAAYPARRLGSMLEDARPRLLVSTRALYQRLPATELPCLLLDESGFEREPTTPPGAGVGPLHLAYIDFTSGSTGRPKGVCISHGSVLRTVLDTPYAESGPEHSFLLIAPISFDASTLEVWGPLLNGGRLVVFPPESPGDGKLLSEVLARHEVSTLHLTAGLLTHMVDGHLRGLSGLKQLLTGGDVVSAPHVRQVLSTLQLPVTACYGPTENTLFTSCHRMRHAEEVPPTVPIGRPIGNTRVYVLDEHLQPVPVGVGGELYTSGDGLARGYLDAEATAERFIPHPFSTKPGARMYRTGDLARWRKDGVLEFLGRRDTQVKVRGFRIELSEVDAALRAHPAVREALSMAREDVPGNKLLVAYVVEREGQTLEAASLRAFLRERLPEYMVPSAFVPLPALPLTSNGKVDREALPAPEGALLSSPSFVAPRTPAEELLASLYAQMLRVPRVGAGDDFFTLGGHSLLATQLVSRIRASFGVELPLRTLFEAPTVAALAARLDAAMAGEGARARSKPTPQPRTGPLPLSFAQQRMWFLHQLEPNSPAYNLPAALRLTGRLDVASLERAFSELLRRHEALRTSFPSDGGTPQQSIARPAPFPLQVTDLSAHPSPESEALRLAAEDAARPFELSRGPLVRASLLRLGEDSHVLLLCMHHIISDGWSMGVLVREVASLYQAFSAGQPSPLPELPLQYADFAAWQRQWLQGEALDAQLDWWRQQLEGAPPLLELPTDRPRPPTQSFQGATLPLALSARSSQALKALALRERTTPFMALLSALSVLLHRYSGQDDICVGSPIAGRGHSELEGLIGFFVNTLVLRTRLAPTQSFRELLAHVRETTLGAFAHQDAPFERLVDALRPSRSLSHSPLFQVLFTLQNAPETSLQLPGLSFAPVDSRSSVSKFDLSFTLAEGPEGFTGTLEYATALFDEATASRMATHLCALVEAVTAHPDIALRDLSLLSPEERQQQLAGWSGPRRDYPLQDCLHTRFEAQAARTPEAVALSFEGQHLTYRELNARANRLAWRLGSLGVGPESRVAVCLERSVDMVVALLASLKAGAAYVPLDPAYPRQRLEWMVEDAQAQVLLTHQRLAAPLPAFPGRTLLLDEAPSGESFPVENPPARAHPDNLAYVIFTSGSTGRPKGAMNTHRAVSNRLLWMQEAYGLTSDDVVLQKTPFSFDVSVWEFFWPLLVGARLVVARPGGHQEPAYLTALISRERVTTLHFVPAMLQVFLAEPRVEEACASLRRLICSGEALPAELAHHCLRQLPHVGLHNLYGPTEAAVDVTAWECTPTDTRASVPIGRPISHTRMLVLDAHHQLVPVGVPGELFIAGVQVGRGYLGRPELTAERFIPNPFGTEPGERMYRTGDVARWLPDGSLDYLGRVDFQVKVRGFRIELGEVEAALLRSADIREAVAVARDNASGGKRLVAYLVAWPGRTVDIQALRTFLGQSLPEHMVPSAFVLLEAMPLSPNGKVDRKALPAPESTMRRREDYVAPRTETEQRLARVWSQVLGLERIGLHDDFFELGGDSLMSVRVAALATEQGLPLQVRQMFQHKTLAELATVLEREPQAPREARPGSRHPAVDEELPMLPQQRWLVETFDVETHGWAATLGWDMPEHTRVDLLKASLAFLDAQHDALRMRLQRTGDGWRLRMLATSGEPRVEEVDLSGLEPEAQRDALIETARRLLTSLSITRGPSLAMALCRLGGKVPDKLVLSIHHSIYDAYSLPLLLEDLRATYLRLASGQPLEAPPVSATYRDYVLAMEDYRRSEVMERARAFWLAPSRLRPLEPMPVDLEGGQHTDLNSRRVTVPLLPALAARLVDYLREHPSVSFNELLLFGVARAWSRWTGSRALRMDVENNGRAGLLPGVDLSRTLGPTTIKFPVLFDVPAHLETRAAFEEVRRTLHETMPLAVGYGLLRYGLEPSVRERLKAIGSPQVFFNNRGASLIQPRNRPAPSFGAESFTLKRADGQANIISYDLMIECDGTGAEFRMSWVYSSQMLRDETARALARGTFDALAELTEDMG